METAKFSLEVDYDPSVTTADAVLEALQIAMSTVLDTPDLLNSVGNPGVGTLVLERDSFEAGDNMTVGQVDAAAANIVRGLRGQILKYAAERDSVRQSLSPFFGGYAADDLLARYAVRGRALVEQRAILLLIRIDQHIQNASQGLAVLPVEQVNQIIDDVCDVPTMEVQ